MTIQEELRTAYANLKGHQDRSMNYIRIMDAQREEISRLKDEVAGLKEELASTHLETIGLAAAASTRLKFGPGYFEFVAPTDHFEWPPKSENQ